MLDGINFGSESYCVSDVIQMATTAENKNSVVVLRSEIKLQINQSLFEKGIISREVYELAKVKIVNDT